MGASTNELLRLGFFDVSLVSEQLQLFWSIDVYNIWNWFWIKMQHQKMHGHIVHYNNNAEVSPIYFLHILSQNWINEGYFHYQAKVVENSVGNFDIVLQSLNIFKGRVIWRKTWLTFQGCIEINEIQIYRKSSLILCSFLNFLVEK